MLFFIWNMIVLAASAKELPPGPYLDICKGCVYQDDGWLVCDRCDEGWQKGDLAWHDKTYLLVGNCKRVIACGGILYCDGSCLPW